ncbi:MAG: hypothetical protein ACPG4T_03895 [Nannocystaceae bacterium]
MLFLDSDVSWAGHRSVRELLLLLGGISLTVAEATSSYIDVGNLIVYAGATLVFASRFYLARAVAVGACIGAIAQQWPHLRSGLEHATMETLAVLPLLAIALLCSRDLVERFDRGESRWSWVPNPWVQYSVAQTRTIRWSCYALGALTGLLDHTFRAASRYADTPLWPVVCMVAAILMITALGLGRAVGLLGVWLVGLWSAVALAPEVWQAELEMRNGISSLDPGLLRGPHYVLPMFLLATFAAVIATPSAFRLLLRVFGREHSEG